jgi:hypothetical protein
MTNSLSVPASSPESPVHALLAMMLGAAQTQLLSVAAQLRLADLIQAGTTSITDLAATTGTAVPVLSRVMHALTRLGLFVETAPQQFTCTPVGALLQSDTPDSLREYAIHFGHPALFRTWPHLLHSVHTGTSAFEDLFGISVYTYLQQHPADAAVFYEAWTSVSKQEARALCAVYDFSACQTVVDVGGGRGFLLATLLQTYPALQGILLDLPAVTDSAHAVLQAAVSAGRCQIVGGDFLTAVPPGGDVYILKRILVDRDDAQAHTLLANCRAAMGPQGRVVVADPDLTSLYGACFDMLMLGVFGSGSRIRTEAELRALFGHAGFTLTQTLATPSTLRIVEGVPA